MPTNARLPWRVLLARGVIGDIRRFEKNKTQTQQNIYHTPNTDVPQSMLNLLARALLNVTFLPFLTISTTRILSGGHQ